jgi:RNA polymerase sigma-70 factor (ECF subfamily)
VATRNTSPTDLLDRARAGDSEALGRLLEQYRNYLRFLARSLLGSALKVQLDPSDLVQETFLEAHRDFAHFAGGNEGELTAWLRRMLVRNLVDQARHHEALARDLQRRESLEDLLERSSTTLHEALASPAVSPSRRVEEHEQAVLLADALEALPADYREVIQLRNFEHLPFEEVGARMGRTSGAARMLWTRALERLHHLMEGHS